MSDHWHLNGGDPRIGRQNFCEPAGSLTNLKFSDHIFAMSSEINPEDEYPEENLPIFEAIWGKGFISPGGPEEVAEILAGIDLTNLKVLDIGCGTGGVDIILARDYGAVHVTGIDVESSSRLGRSYGHIQRRQFINPWSGN